MKKIYLETTVFNYYFLDDIKRAYEKKITRLLFKEIGQAKFKGIISDMVLVELSRCYEPLKSKMLGLIEKFNLERIEISKREEKNIEDLANSYIKFGIILERKKPDAVHIALASLFQVDFLVSWNCKHIVRPELQERINAVNTSYGFKEVKLCTPLEVVYYE